MHVIAVLPWQQLNLNVCFVVLRSSAHRNQQKPPTGPAGRPESAPEPPAGPRPPADPRPSKRPGLEPAADGESGKV